MAMFPALMNDTIIYAMDSSGRVLTDVWTSINADRRLAHGSDGCRELAR
ncbi:hypothetical protein BHAP_0920 [Bifidobacterium hapali]|uniref:Uncharacterized protein n=1 Tax=Bifidobacterium hapali TaxID=1630172 RepID=A0A261FZT7_9BIFI|nr:hypothetical protein [Bifidobacterium hapali]OZG64690.1 hypothetical protein BHAP_0920 [Bifidobacterium hapali]